jgi:C4-dicarboxylate-specific signal transduction histidine kinase
MLGRDPAALRPLRHGTWDELCHPDDHPGATAALQRHLDGTTSFFERELRLRHADGRWVWVLTRGQVLRRDGQGHPLAMGGTTLDITARKHAEQVLTRSRDELERLVAERTAALRESQRRLTDAARQAGMAQVAAGILHNVGNVLTAVVAVVEQLRNEARRPLALRSAELLALVLEAPDATRFLTSDERGRKVPEIWQRLSPALDRERQAYALHLEELHRHVQHIVAIVASQQRYATGQFLIEPCDARDLLHEALTLAAPALARCGAHTCLHAPDAAPLATDRHHVVDALAAGLVNAAEAVADAEDRLVLIAIHHHHGGVSMTITDHGCGFPPQLQPRLFQHGFTTKPGHRGFAMHTAAANLRSIGGAISLTSPGLGLGAVCTITLPHERSSGT